MFKTWLLVAIATTGLSLMIFAGIQQTLRLSANDPQIQLAEDAATALTNGQPFQSVVPAQVVDLTKSLAPFVIVFNEQGAPLFSSVQIDGKTPIPPTGVFDYVRQNGQDKITWQPGPSTRIATVVTRYTGTASGFVVAGRSLSAVESRIANLQMIILAGWAGTLAITFVVLMILGNLRKSR